MTCYLCLRYYWQTDQVTVAAAIRCLRPLGFTLYLVLNMTHFQSYGLVLKQPRHSLPVMCRSHAIAVEQSQALQLPLCL